MHFHAIVVGTGRDDETAVRQLQRQDTLLWRLLRKENTDTGLIAAGLAIGRVVHLEHEIRAAWNKLGHAIGPEIG